MATSTLLQQLGVSADGFGSSTSNRRQVETFILGGTVSVGDVVALDLSQSADGDKGLIVVRADTAVATATMAVGVVLRGLDYSATGSVLLTSGYRVEVVTRGLVSANVDGTTVAGSRLIVGATAGQLLVAPDIVESGAATVPQRPIVAIAAEADTANVAKVYVLANF